MDKKIVFGSISAVFILMMLSSVSAAEFNTAVETNRSQILEMVQNTDIEELKVKIKD